MKIIKLIVVVIIVLAIGAGAYYYSLKQVEFHDFRIEEVEMGGLTEITIIGEIDIYNGGFLKFNVENITYTIIIESSGNRLTKGIIQGGLLNAKETKAFPFENQISLLASGEAILNFLNEDNTFVKVSGTITLANNLKVPFEKRIDMEPYLEDFADINLDPGSIEMAKGLIGALGAAFT